MRGNPAPYPCRCLWRGFSQITRTTPYRRMILHLSQRRLTEARTFIALSARLILESEAHSNTGLRHEQPRIVSNSPPFAHRCEDVVAHDVDILCTIDLVQDTARTVVVDQRRSLVQEKLQPGLDGLGPIVRPLK